MGEACLSLRALLWAVPPLMPRRGMQVFRSASRALRSLPSIDSHVINAPVSRVGKRAPHSGAGPARRPEKSRGGVARVVVSRQIRTLDRGVRRARASWRAARRARRSRAPDAGTPTPASRPTPRAGGGTRSSTRSSSGASPTRTATASATSQGLTAHLDALNDGDAGTGNDLGVDALWLMPIHPSPSYHGYDVTDYRERQPGLRHARRPRRPRRRGPPARDEGHPGHGAEPLLARSTRGSSTRRAGPRPSKRNWYVWRARRSRAGASRSARAGPGGSLNGAYYYGVFCSCDAGPEPHQPGGGDRAGGHHEVLARARRRRLPARRGPLLHRDRGRRRAAGPARDPRLPQAHPGQAAGGLPGRAAGRRGLGADRHRRDVLRQRRRGAARLLLRPRRRDQDLGRGRRRERASSAPWPAWTPRWPGRTAATTRRSSPTTTRSG